MAKQEKKEDPQGFVDLPVLLLVVAGLLVVGGGAYYKLHQQSVSTTQTPTQDQTTNYSGN